VDATVATSSATGTQLRDCSTNPILTLCLRVLVKRLTTSLELDERSAGRGVAGGVGSLIGAKGEESVAMLPDERDAMSDGVPNIAEGGKRSKLSKMDQAECEARSCSAGYAEARAVAGGGQGGE